MNEEYVKQIYASFAETEPGFLQDEPDVELRLALMTVSKRPELRPLLQGVTFHITHKEDGIFSITEKNVIRINPGILEKPVVAAFHLRHALELNLLLSRLDIAKPGLVPLVAALSSLHTAIFYLYGMIAQEKDEVVINLPDWLNRILDDVAKYSSSGDYIPLSSLLSEQLRFALPLQGKDINDFDTADIDEAGEICIGMLPLAKPAEKILTEGGDSRLHMDPIIGLNQYGCSSRPRPWAITFSSCTSSSISDYAYYEAELLRHKLLLDSARGELAVRCRTETDRMRQEISSLLTLDEVPGTEIILSPSGTDAEFYALYFATRDKARPICNIVVSTTEIGSGTVQAAGGRHFDRFSPISGRSEIGEAVDGFDTEAIEVRYLELRDEDGDLYSAQELDNRARTLVENAIAEGKQVLLHLLDCSKTGVGAPSVELAQELLERHPDRLSVMADTAQMRIGRAALRRYIESGFMALVTGSKFFTGAPFSGALVLPPAVMERIEDHEELPRGIDAYSTCYDLPESLLPLSHHLPDTPNLGLMLRWQAGLWEMNAFFNVSALDQFNIINTFGQAILEMIEHNPDTELVMAPTHDRGYPPTELSWDQLPTIFTFLIYKMDSHGTRKPLTYEQARFAYQCINTDIARFLPVHASEREYSLAAKRCHIGQPVRIHRENGEWIGALRIAAGARLVSGVQYDCAFGDSSDQRLETEISYAATVYGKLSVIVKYWDSLAIFDPALGTKPGACFYLF